MDSNALIHPGEVLKEEFLILYGLSANRLARAIGVPANRITAIINGNRGITGETAVLLGHAFGTTPEFWLNLQSRFSWIGQRPALPMRPFIEQTLLHASL